MKNLNDLQLSTRIINALLKGGIDSISQLKKLSYDELLSIKGISKKSVDEIQNVMKELQINNTKSINSKTFNNNNVYIFTKKKYIKSEGRKKYLTNKDLINKLNGRLVINGIINDIEIDRQWCISK